MSCPYLKECFKKSVTERQRCINMDQWRECPIYLKKIEIEQELQRLREMRKDLEEMFKPN